MDAEKRLRRKRTKDQADEKRTIVSSATDLNKKRKVTETSSKDIKKPSVPEKAVDKDSKPWESNA
jgi:hypothetical protein